MATPKKNAKDGGDRLIARNRRAHYDYEIGTTYEAGVVLIGSEVRALRDRAGDLTDAWVDIDSRGEAWIKGMRIPELMHAAFAHQEKRPRKLLLHAQQIETLRTKKEAEGMTIVATKCYFREGRVKLEVALARGKKSHDKRQALRERETEREARDAMRRVHRS
ncbi:MAG: SsrA-binding protein SmpB [Myxococcales bacterium]